MTPRASVPGRRAGEGVLRGLCRRLAIPEPVREHRFHDRRRWRFDYAWPDRRVAIEVEGGIFARKNGRRGAHGSVSGILRDIEKYSEAAALGWLIIRSRADAWPSLVALERAKRAMESR